MCSYHKCIAFLCWVVSLFALSNCIKQTSNQRSGSSAETDESESTRLLLQVEKFGSSIEVSWTEIPEAEFYTLTIALDSKCDSPIFKFEEITSTNQKVSLTDNADYFVCIYATTNDGNIVNGSNNGVKIALPTETTKPTSAATSVSFLDTDLDGGQISGTVKISKAINESSITHYSLYWGSSATTKLTSTPIATLAKTGKALTYSISPNTVIPAGATHLLVFTKNSVGEMEAGTSVAIVDLGVPTNAAVSASFTDTDTDGGQISGNLNITKAADESDLTSYVVYWGSSPNTKESSSPIAILAKTAANLVYNFPADTVKPPLATHLLVFTANDDGEMGTGISVAIIDVGVPSFGAGGLAFSDTDLVGGTIGGDVTITKALYEADIDNYVLYWGDNATTKNSFTPIATLGKTGSDLTYTIPAGTPIPAGATHFLVYTENADGEIGVPVSVAIVDAGVPVNAATSVTFTDTDLDGGELSGDIHITIAADESDLTHYVVYWGSDATTKLSPTPIDTVAKTSGNITVTLPANTSKPMGATHFLVFTENQYGQMTTGVSVAITDLGVPTHAASSLSFTDTDNDANQIAGTVTIGKALDESDITHYVLYWGTSSSTKQSTTAITEIAADGNDVTYTFAADTVLPAGATHLLVYTKNASGEMATGLDVVITDTVVSAGSITVTSHNVGSCMVASPVTVTWTSSNTSGNVMIELSTNNGATWTVVIASTPDVGSYGPIFTSGPNNRIRVTDVVDPTITDTNDSPFGGSCL